MCMRAMRSRIFLLYVVETRLCKLCVIYIYGDTSIARDMYGFYSSYVWSHAGSTAVYVVHVCIKKTDLKLASCRKIMYSRMYTINTTTTASGGTIQ